MFNEIDTCLSKYKELATSNTSYPFQSTIYVSLICLGAKILRPEIKNTLPVISCNSRNPNTQEQFFSTYDNDLCDINIALTTCDFFVHNPVSFSFTIESNLTARQYKAQMSLTKISNLRIMHNEGASSTIADMKSRDFSIITNNSLQHKTLTSHFEFTKLQPNHSLQQVPYLLKQPTQKRFTPIAC